MSFGSPQGSPGGVAVSSGNSTSANLASSATFTGTWEQSAAPDLLVSVKVDQNCTLLLDFSNNGGTTTHSTITYEVRANTPVSHRVVKGARHFRIRLTNDGASTTTALSLFVSFGNFGPLTSALNTSVQHDGDCIVTRAVTEETTVAAGLFAGYYIVNKFGRNADVDAAEDIWDGGGDYTGFPTGSAETITVVSSSVNDTSSGTGARTLRIYGLDANFALQNEDVTLNGTVGVATVNTYKRVFRAYVLTAGSGTTNEGTLTVRHTTTTANVFTVIPAGLGQSEVTSYTIPAGYTGFLRRYNASMADNTSNSAIIAIKVREFGGAVRLIRTFAMSTTGPVTREVYGGVSFPEKTDFVFRVTSIANTNGNVSATWDMVVVEN